MSGRARSHMVAVLSWIAMCSSALAQDSAVSPAKPAAAATVKSPPKPKKKAAATAEASPPAARITVTVSASLMDVGDVVQQCEGKYQGHKIGKTRIHGNEIAIDCDLPFEKLRGFEEAVKEHTKGSKIRATDPKDPDGLLDHCDGTKLEHTCEGSSCTCEAFKQRWHYWMVGLLGELSGAIRGYGHATGNLAFQVGFRSMAIEGAVGLTRLKIQSLPAVEERSFDPALELDARTIFYGNGRNRAGFFIGGGITYVPRDTIHDADNRLVTLPDPRVEWWVRSPFGIEVRFATFGNGLVLDNPDMNVVGRAFVEPWFPVGKLENEVTVMFGIAFGIYAGDRNDKVPFAK